MHDPSRPSVVVALSLLVVVACTNTGGTPVGAQRSPTASIAAASVEPASTSAPASADPSPAASLEFPLTVENCGEDVTAFQRPERIMVVGNVATNHVIAAGGTDLIVARAGPHDGALSEPYASAVADIPVIDEDDPSPETIIGAGVDTVISYGTSHAESIREAGISSLVVSSACAGRSGTFEEIYDEVEWYGRLFDTQDVANAAVADMQQRVDAIDVQEAAGQTAASAYFFGEILSTDGNQAISDAMMEALGLTNVFADVDASFIEENLEELVDRDPEVLILIYGYNGETFEEALQQMLAAPGVADTRAALDARIVGLNSSQGQNDPAAIDGLEGLARQIGKLPSASP